ncbi:ENTH-domain-containing protein [Trametes versicolor FP-101664 SS1]|uniref:ENTH-domain-containing protein n=1 Tax=Trametes versicolor (strain FP-101664) TaxID=717944 RepID=UPI00046215AD|nr:ENTH-domain-containing protein [Trametes versicolor FP-101664 SS1]EIW63759.1 ENTH-domain-containing protein [Trametes versicolor FP-101664 SS1]
MSLQHFGKGALRVAKSYTMGYSHTQMKIRNATCNDPWPPSGKEMYELAQMSFNQNDFVEIMEVIDKRLNDKGKNWRHVFKSLVVLDYLLHSGSENVINYCEDNLYEIKTLREFQYIDEDGKDQGANVRQKAKDITNLLVDKKRLYEERRIRSQMRDRMLGPSRATAADGEDVQEDGSQRRHRPNGDDEELQRAIEESKRTAEQELATAEDRDLQRAIQMSQEEEEKRKRALDEANAAALFDESNQQPPPIIQTQPLIDATVPLQYTSAGIPPQFTAFQPDFTSIQPQFTSYNPYLQQAQQDAMQAEYMRQQAEWARQQELLAQQQQPMLVPFQTVFQPPLQPFASPLVPQTTSLGSNNPFIAPPSPPISPASSTFLPQRAASASLASPVSFNLPGTYDDRPRPARDTASAPPRGPGALLQPFSTGTEPPRKLGGGREHARLASLFASYTGDGVDTFGNTGQLRFMATQHGMLAAQKTGAGAGGQSRNPFVHPEVVQPPIVEENLIEI